MYELAGISFEQFLPIIVGGLITSIAFFVSRAFARADSSRDDIASINQAIGLLSAAKDRAQEKDAEHSRAIDGLRREVLELRERCLILEHSGGVD